MSAIKIKGIKQLIVGGVTQPISIGGSSVDNSDEVMNIASNGDLQFKKIIQTNGIKFPATQVSSADPNTLDDYEEGSWAPTTPTPNLTISIQTTSYTKIGNMVFAKCYIEINNTSGSIINAYRISGLPFTSVGYGFATNYFQGSQVSRYVETYGNFVDWIQDLAVGSNLRMYQFVYNTF